MKKRLLIKESELKNFVENYIKENEEISDSLTEMIEEKYKEILGLIENALDMEDVAEMEEIYDNQIFSLSKQINKNQELKSKFFEKFSNLEDYVVDYIELYKEHESLTQELNSSAENLRSLL